MSVQATIYYKHQLFVIIVQGHTRTDIQICKGGKMEKKEAIKELKTVYLGDTEEIREAKDMAIEALSADTISREEAIHAIDLCRERKNKEIKELRTKCLEAEQRANRPIGVWVDNGRYTECSECGEVAQRVEVRDGVYERLTNFCPNCGAIMENKE